MRTLQSLLLALLIALVPAVGVAEQDAPVQARIDGCWVFSNNDIRSAEIEDGAVIVWAWDRMPLDRCQEFAGQAGNAWQVVQGLPDSSAQPLAQAYLLGKVQCEMLTDDGGITVRTVSAGKADGGYWCRQLGLAKPIAATTEFVLPFSLVGNAIDGPEQIELRFHQHISLREESVGVIDIASYAPTDLFSCGSGGCWANQIGEGTLELTASADKQISRTVRVLVRDEFE